MNGVFKVFLSLSVSGSLLILILLACRPFLKDRVSRQWQYYIWLAVVLRLALPFSPGAGLVGSAFHMLDNTAYAGGSMLQAQEPAVEAQGKSSGSEARQELGDTGEGKQMKQPAAATPIREIFSLLAQNIWLVWLVVAAILMVRKVTVYQSFVRYVKAGQVPVSDTGLLDQLALAGEQAGVRRPVELCVNPLITSPLLIGFLHPCIVLPRADYSEKDFYFAALHELMHCKRQDMLYKWVVQAVVCLHWFNPLVHLMGREINRACEFSCDEAVMKRMDWEKRKQYGEVLLNSMAAVGTYDEALASVTLNGNKKLLKERLGAIVNYKKKSAAAAAGTALLTLVFCLGTVAMGSYGAEDSRPVEGENAGIEVGGSIYGRTLCLVYTEEGLRSIGTKEYGPDLFYMLANDIELSGGEWVPIGTEEKPFTGYFDGNGCYIKGLTMTDPDAETIGLFGYADGAALHNIELRNVDIETAGANAANRRADPICAVPRDTSMTDNRVYLQIKPDPSEDCTMEVLEFMGKTYYMVCNEAQLRAIGTGEYSLDKNYMQQADIQLSTEEWVPIGTADAPFTGSFNGNGCEIIGLTITNPDTKIAGLFGYAENANIYNITMRDYDIETAGRNVTGKSVAPIVVFGMGTTRSYDNHVYPREY